MNTRISKPHLQLPGLPGRRESPLGGSLPVLCLSEALPQEPQGMQTLHLTSAQAEQFMRIGVLLT